MMNDAPQPTINRELWGVEWVDALVPSFGKPVFTSIIPDIPTGVCASAASNLELSLVVAGVLQ